MLLHPITFLCLSSITLKTWSFSPKNLAKQFDEQTYDKLGENKLTKRQTPWLPPQTFQSFGNPLFFPNNRDNWRYPCGPYPSYTPAYSPPPPIPYPPATPPSSSSDDPNDILNRMSGENDKTTSKKEPSRCVWAVVACCSPGSRDIRYSCFELLGCPGAFWDVNPCEDRIVMAAANSALAFYSNINNGTSNSTTS